MCDESERQTSFPWTSSAVGSLVKMCPSPDAAQGSAASGPASGTSSNASSTRCSRSRSSSKTSLDSFGGAWSALSPGSANSVTRWKRPASARRTSGPRTSESGSSSWPTPTVKGNYAVAGQTEKGGNGLATAVRLWPTPTACPSGSNQNGSNATRPSAGTPSLYTLAAREGAPLNPYWVEALMGFPIGWTGRHLQASLPGLGSPPEH